MSQTEIKKTATLRDRLEDDDLVILTRGIKIPDPEGIKRRYPAGQYAAGDLPEYAYEQGLVVHEPKAKDLVKTPESPEPNLKTKK